MNNQKRVLEDDFIDTKKKRVVNLADHPVILKEPPTLKLLDTFNEKSSTGNTTATNPNPKSADEFSRIPVLSDHNLTPRFITRRVIIYILQDDCKLHFIDNYEKTYPSTFTKSRTYAKLLMQHAAALCHSIALNNMNVEQQVLYIERTLEMTKNAYKTPQYLLGNDSLCKEIINVMTTIINTIKQKTPYVTLKDDITKLSELGMRIGHILVKSYIEDAKTVIEDAKTIFLPDIIENLLICICPLGSSYVQHMIADLLEKKGGRILGKDCIQCVYQFSGSSLQDYFMSTNNIKYVFKKKPELLNFYEVKTIENYE